MRAYLPGIAVIAGFFALVALGIWLTPEPFRIAWGVALLVFTVGGIAWEAITNGRDRGEWGAPD